MLATVEKARGAGSGLGDQSHWGFSRPSGFCLISHRVPITFYFLCSLLLPLNSYLKIRLWFERVLFKYWSPSSGENAIRLLMGFLFINRPVTVLPSNPVSSLSLKWLKMFTGGRVGELFFPCHWLTINSILATQNQKAMQLRVTGLYSILEEKERFVDRNCILFFFVFLALCRAWSI